MIPEQRTFIGGARMGSLNATIPFARLVVESGKATLRCFRAYVLTPKYTTCESIGSIPVLSSGVRFYCIDVDYPEPLIFWCLGRKRVVEALEKSGFEFR
jgi:hypothetical protein